MIALVTGGNRGLGLEVCRQLAAAGHQIILGSRDLEKGQKAAAEIGKGTTAVELDVRNPESVDAVVRFVNERFGRLDILVNNAGVLIDKADVGATTFAVLQETVETNSFGPFLLCQKLAPLMKKNGYGRIVNVSSGMGQLSEMNSGWPAYRMSKAALNVVTKVFADEYQGEGILVNSVCPGWVRTDMGGAGAERSPEEAAKGLVWAATLPNNGPTGGFFRDSEAIAW